MCVGGQQGGVSMRIHNLYAGPAGETHFRDVEVECTDAGDQLKPEVQRDCACNDAMAFLVWQVRAALARRL
jgi:hypothetical protein